MRKTWGEVFRRKSRGEFGPCIQVQKQFKAKLVILQVLDIGNKESKVTFWKYRKMSKFLRGQIFTYLDFA